MRGKTFDPEREPVTMTCAAGGEAYWTGTLGEHIVCPKTRDVLCTQDCTGCADRGDAKEVVPAS